MTYTTYIDLALVTHFYICTEANQEVLKTQSLAYGIVVPYLTRCALSPMPSARGQITRLNS